MSSAPAAISLAEYMSTDYEPDCDYVDGFIEERNVGKKKHGKTQGALYANLLALRAEHGCDVLLEQRVRVAKSRVRIPDICLALPDPEEVVEKPPLLWIEVLSPEDRWNRVQTRLNDALAFGVQTIWVVDPYSKQAWHVTTGGTVAIEDGKLHCSNPRLEIALSEILPGD
jgi:Uma2 family endonuclease